MKAFLILISLYLFIQAALASDPLSIGKIVKTKHETYNTNYFVVMTKDGKDFAYPIAPDSKIKNLHTLKNKTFKIYGKTVFRKDPKKEGSYVLYFKINKADELQLKDLALKQDINLQDPNILKNKTEIVLESTHNGPKEGAIRVSDKAANTAIFLGGAAIAAEVLSHILK